MAAFEENGASSAPADEHEIINEKQDHDSDASSATKAGRDANLEGAENVAPHTSHHSRFGTNQVFANNNNDDSEELPGIEKAGTYDKIELTEDMCYDELGYSFSEWRKW
jgi:hypothetical protein